MNRDEKRYNNNRVELNRTHKQGDSNQSHDLLALDGVDWDVFSKKGKPVVLDLRCGAGKSTVERFGKYLDKVKAIIGIDCSESKIAFAQKTHKDFKEIDFYCCDLDSPDIEIQLKSILAKHNAKEFGLILGGYVLIHLCDPKKLVCKLFNLIQNDGYVFFQEPDEFGKICYPNQDVLKTIIDCFDALPWIEDRFFAKKIPQLLHSAGFTNIECLYNTMDNLSKSTSEKRHLYDITFSHRRSDYDCVSEQEMKENIHIAKRLDEALDLMKDLFTKTNFYYVETRYIFTARKRIVF